MDDLLPESSFPIISGPLFAPAECRLEVLKLWLHSWNQINSNHVEPHLRKRLLRQLRNILPGQPAQHTALAGIDNFMRRKHVPGSACLHLNHAERRSLPGYQVEIAAHIAGRPTSRGDRVAIAHQVKTSRIFAFDPSHQVRWKVNSAAAAFGHPVEAIQ